MKRQIIASEQTAFRVMSVGLDVVIPAEADGYAIAQQIENLLNQVGRGKFRVAASDVHDDLTDTYESDYPSDLYIDGLNR